MIGMAFTENSYIFPWLLVVTLYFVPVSLLEIQRIDGYYNNLANPKWGAIGDSLLRRVPAAYKDGKKNLREGPSERLISETVLKGPTGLRSFMNKTAFLALLGQYVSFETIMSSGPGCPREASPILVPACDADYDPGCTGRQKLPFSRANYDKSTGKYQSNPRRLKNGVTAFIDGSVIYSTSKLRLSDMRSYKHGKLRTDNDEGLYPPKNKHKMPVKNLPRPLEDKVLPSTEHWLTPDKRSSMTSANMMFYILFMRYHNLMADKYRSLQPTWDDEQVFQAARRWVIAVEQKIFAYDFFPAFTNANLPTYTGYKDYVHPGVNHLHQSAAFRFGHSLVPPGFYRRNGQCKFFKTTKATLEPEGYPATRMCNHWFHHKEAFEFGIDSMIMGMTSQITERGDNVLAEDIRGKLFGPIQHTRRDLAAMNIKRGRDSGLPDYNTVRKALGLKPRATFKDINPWLYDRDQELFNRLEKVYKGDVNNIDMYVGGLFESDQNGPGEVFKMIIKDQFTRFRDGDRFWFENRQNGLFTEDEIKEIHKTSFYTIILQTTNISAGEIQENVFFWKAGDPCEQPKQLNATELSQCSANKGFDFSGNSTTECALIVNLIMMIPMMSHLLVVVVYHIRKRMRNADVKNTDPVFQVIAGNTDVVFDKGAWEYQGHGKWRHVEVAFSEEQSRIKLLNKRKQVVQSLLIGGHRYIDLLVATDRGRYTMAIKSGVGADMVINFKHESDIKSLSYLIKDATEQNKIGFTRTDLPELWILAKIISREAIMKEVDTYMRSILADLFESHVRHEIFCEVPKEDMIYLDLTKIDFAEVMGLDTESALIDIVYESLDDKSSGSVKLTRFLALLIFLCSVPTANKLKTLFDMYDMGNKGFLRKMEFEELARIIEDIADDHSDGMFFEEMLAASHFDDEHRLTLPGLVQLAETSKRFQEYLERSSSRLKRVATHIAQRPTIKELNMLKHRGISKLSSIPLETGFSMVEIPKTGMQRRVAVGIEFITNYHPHIACLLLFYAVIIGLFAHTAHNSLTNKRFATLSKLAGPSVAVSSGTATVMKFLFAVILLTECKHTINVLRRSVVFLWIPLDSIFTFHKIAVLTAMCFAVIHVIGQVTNFYNLSSYPPDVIACAFQQKISFGSKPPTFSFWFFGNMTGLTGLLLIATLSSIGAFSTPWAMHRMYSVFFLVHKLFIPLYALIVVHGSVGLFKEPSFHLYVIGPAIIYTCEKVYGLRTKTAPLPVVRVENMPSGVLHLTIKKPEDFTFIPGQFAELACEGICSKEFHPFTITSTPDEKTLSFYIRVLGPWTRKLTEAMDVASDAYPPMYVHGPFGRVFGDFHKFEVSVIVAGGIGVTAFASILKQLVYDSRGMAVRCKKIYFVWSTKRQTHWEWVVNVLRKIEQIDTRGFINMHLFVTQHYMQDLRTFLMFVGENHMSRTRGYTGNLFASLESTTHFGSPDFPAFFAAVAREHKNVSKIGVFTSGPPMLTGDVRKACWKLNKTTDTNFMMYDENFGG